MSFPRGEKQINHKKILKKEGKQVGEHFSKKHSTLFIFFYYCYYQYEGNHMFGGKGLFYISFTCYFVIFIVSGEWEVSNFGCH